MDGFDESTVAPRSTNQRSIADERARFLEGFAGADVHVRQTILASWYRSRESHVQIDRLRVPYVADRDLESPLERSAKNVLTDLHERLHDESISIILTDQTGLVLDRRSTGMAIMNKLDDVFLAPGFSYAEQFAGTNGIGTALSSGTAALVTGSEHYADLLGQFACAGAPIRHPTTRRTIGVLDLTSWTATSGPLLLALATATARQIEDELRAQTGLREIALFEDYLAACKQSLGPVLALNGDAVMTNEQLRTLLDSAEQQTLINYAADTVSSTSKPMQRAVDLPGGRVAQLRYAPTASTAGPAGGVFRIRLVAAANPSRKLAGSSRGGSVAYPGIVGSGAAWLRCVQHVDSWYRAGDLLALHGEPGVGKRAILRAVHMVHDPARSFRVVDPTLGDDDDWMSDLSASLETPGTVVLVHAERLDEGVAASVAELLTQLARLTEGEPSPRVAVTLTSGELAEPLAALFRRSIEVPPLRRHIEDVAVLVRYLLGQLPGGSRLAFSHAAMSQLTRVPWPGNIGQLRKVLRAIVEVRHSGVVEVNDLPPDARAAVRRMLTPLESLERDAIITALADNDENPTRAAAAVGMSRSTIYRKLRQYGITLPLQL